MNNRTGWRITKDFLYEGPNDLIDSVAGVQSYGFDLECGVLKFRLYDDDDILYYEGIAYDEFSVEAAYDYWQVDSGVTHSTIYQNGEWVDYI